jgi:glycosyltransferase involved in cell wall biosynthesis
LPAKTYIHNDMRVWLLHVGEELPVDGAVRRYRYGFLAEALVNAGHDVLRWAPTFRHLAKKQRYATDCRVSITPRYDIQFIQSPGYRRNIGLQRLRSYRILDRRLRKLAERETPPDLIVSAIPTLEWANAAVDLGRANGIPVVIDVRDVWPDVYLNALPAIARPAMRLFLAGQFRLAERACRYATAITAVSRSYLNWALKLAQREVGESDAVVPLGFEPDPVPAAALTDRISMLRRRGIDPARPTCFFAGRFERSYDLATVIDAARRLRDRGRNDVQFVLCGDGAQMATIQSRACQSGNVHLLGWVDPATMQAVASVSSIGMCAYASDATQSVPNKPFEYMAARVAVVSSLQGEMAELLDKYQCGLTYRADDSNSLANCLAMLLDNPALLERMRCNAFEAWTRHYKSGDIYAGFVKRLMNIPANLAKAA